MYLFYFYKFFIQDEELQLKKTYEETIRVKKETLIDLKKYNRDKSEERMTRQINEIDSMENYYKTRFEILNEQLKKERELSKKRENSQQRLVSKIKSHIREKYENELNHMQEQMYRSSGFFCLKGTL